MVQTPDGSQATFASSDKQPVQHLWLPGRVPGMNELIAARADIGAKRDGKGKRWSGYTQIKRQYEEKVVMCARTQGLLPFESARFRYLILENDRRRDPSNIVFGAVKLIEDGLQKAGMLKGDGWKGVLGIAPVWRVAEKDEPAGVFVLMLPPSRMFASVIDVYNKAKLRGFQNERR